MNKEKIEQDTQLFLLGYFKEDVIAQLEMNKEPFSHLHKIGLISFEISGKKDLTYPEYLEVKFISNIFTSGISFDGIEAITRKL